MKSVVLSVAGDVMVESGARLWWRLAWPRLSCNVPGPVLDHSCLTSTIPPHHTGGHGGQLGHGHGDVVVDVVGGGVGVDNVL